MTDNRAAPWESLSREEKKARMIRQQKELLETLRSRGAISQEAYDKAMRALDGVT